MKSYSYIAQDARHKQVKGVINAENEQEFMQKVKEKGPVFGFGMGDIILMAAGGLMLGLKATITAAFIAVIFAAIYGVYKKTVDDDNAFAFGPFLCAGLVVSAFINGYLIDVYLQMLSR